MTPAVFDPHLSSVAVARTTLSDIDGTSGSLVVCGYPIEELAANATYEEVVFLLFEDRLPTDEELDEFRADLASRRDIDGAVRDLLCAAADRETPPMDALRLGLDAISLDTAGTGTADTARQLVAVAPTILATYWRYRQGEEPVAPRSELGHVANYRYMLTGTAPDDAAIEGLEAFFVTVVEHGMNTPTFAARTVVSTQSDLVSGATAAIGALKGERHSGDFDDLFALLERLNDVGDYEGAIRESLDEGERFPGFGHPVYRVRDPRAAVLSAAAEQLAEQSGSDFHKTARTFEEQAIEILRSERPDSHARPTLEFYIAPLLHDAGIPSDLFAATFALGRLGGCLAHCLEQLDTDRLIRPSARYVGSSASAWPPLDQRHAVGDALLGQPPQSSSLESVSETFATLSEPNRLEILLALYGADRPLPYSTLRDAISIEDKGRFNYHLRQLRESFVTERGDGYTLTEAGQRVVDTLLAEDRLLRPS